MSHTLVGSPLGELTLVFDGDVLTGLYIPHHWCRPDASTFGEFVADGAFEVRRQLAEYFAGERTEFDVPVRAIGDEFQQRVWKLISRIPCGSTTTYGEMAAELGDPTQARDVGAAVGRNPLCIVIPCHRVVGKDGKLTGYAGGLERKRFLLELEEGDAGRLF
jgi:methylated-DNA-[protein]-cysteine S-methyltransferase